MNYEAIVYMIGDVSYNIDNYDEFGRVGGV